MTETERFIDEFVARYLYWAPIWPVGKTVLDVTVQPPSYSALALLSAVMARDFPDLGQNLINDYPGGPWRVRMWRRS